MAGEEDKGVRGEDDKGGETAEGVELDETWGMLVCGEGQAGGISGGVILQV